MAYGELEGFHSLTQILFQGVNVKIQKGALPRKSRSLSLTYRMHK